MRPALVQAAENSDFKKLRKLIHEGCDINERDYNGWSALCWAISQLKDEMTEFLIMSGADINAGLPLLVAAQKPDVRFIQILVNNRADLNLQSRTGMTALHYAVENRKEKQIETLLKAKADVNIKDTRGGTPLYYARLRDNYLIINLLEKAKQEQEQEQELEIEKPKSAYCPKTP